MDAKQFVTKHFNGFIDETFVGRHNFIDFFKTHERKQLCINNIVKEFYKIEHSTLKHDITLMKKLTRNFAKMFCLAAINEKEKQLKNKQTEIFDEFGNITKPQVDTKEPELPDGAIEVERPARLVSL